MIERKSFGVLRFLLDPCMLAPLGYSCLLDLIMLSSGWVQIDLRPFLC